MFIKFAKGMVFLFLKIFYRIEIVNKHNVPLNGAAIVCSNHLSNGDVFAIGCGIKRLIRYMAKEELFRKKIPGKIIRYFGAFPIKRGKADVESIKNALKLLKEGHIIGIFPEGTRIKDSNIKLKPKTGVALLAVKSKAPIIPAAIIGKYRLFNKVKVIFGEPFNLQVDEQEKCGNEDLSEIAKNIMNKVYLLMEGQK